jgi:hypothetical protein
MNAPFGENSHRGQTRAGSIQTRLNDSRCGMGRAQLHGQHRNTRMASLMGRLSLYARAREEAPCNVLGLFPECLLTRCGACACCESARH